MEEPTNLKTYKAKNFYSVIIGSELLNGRRKDAHFDFLNAELLKRGWEQKANFVIKDEPKFIEDTFSLIKSDPDSVMFSFGGIGSTPDDYTRQCAANVFTDKKMQMHDEAKKIILDRFGDEAYPHRINMANLPKDAKLLKNVINNIPAFYLEDRFFFVPGFPSMSHPMIIEALDKHYPKNKAKTRLTVKANTSENDIIDTMKTIPSHIDVSSLPQLKGEKKLVVVSVASEDKNEAKKYFDMFIELFKTNNITYEIGKDN